MTIQDIADRATVNRATFYAHFEDKFDLLDSFVRQQFKEVLADKVPLAPVYTMDRLQQIIVTVMEFLLPFHKQCAHADRQQVTSMFESAVQEELNKYLLTWFALTSPSLVPKGVNPQVAANVWSWAIFGMAIQWSQGAQKLPAGEIAREITAVLTTGRASINLRLSREQPVPRLHRAAGLPAAPGQPAAEINRGLPAQAAPDFGALLGHHRRQQHRSQPQRLAGGVEDGLDPLQAALFGLDPGAVRSR